MRIVKVQPKDTSITFEIMLSDIENLVHALDVCTIEPKTEKEKAGFSFLTNVFFPMMNDLVEDLKDGS